MSQHNWTAREVIAALTKAGFKPLPAKRSSHTALVTTIRGRHVSVTIPVHSNQTLDPATLGSIARTLRRDAGLTLKELLRPKTTKYRQHDVHARLGRMRDNLKLGLEINQNSALSLESAIRNLAQPLRASVAQAAVVDHVVAATNLELQHKTSLSLVLTHQHQTVGDFTRAAQMARALHQTDSRLLETVKRELSSLSKITNRQPTLNAAARSRADL